ncbi:McrB family protein [Zhurongbacter thermophilus]
MFGNKEYDSFAYWIEQLNMSSYSANAFGSIWGGNADKFILFQYSEINGRWTSKTIGKNLSPIEKEQAKQDIEIPEESAIWLATLIRNAIIKGAEEVEKVYKGVQTYEELEKQFLQIHEEFLASIPDELKSKLPTIKNIFYRAWVHKYYHILFPQTISSIHTRTAIYSVPITMTYKPFLENYLNDKQLKDLQEKTGYQSFLEMELLHPRYGINYKHPYVKLPTSLENIYKLLKTGVFIWDKENIPPAIKNSRPGTRIYITDDNCHLVAYGYSLESFTDNSLPIDFLSTNIDKKVFCQTDNTIKQFYGKGLIRYSKELISVEEAILDIEVSKLEGKTTHIITGYPATLPEDIKDIWATLRRKKQIIFYGPPGTGKTYMALKSARYIVARENFGDTYSDGIKEKVDNFIEMVTFHPSYSYDDFIEGIKTTIKNGHIHYEIKDGILKSLAQKAQADKDNIYILIIDEINRGDTARIFGELLTLLEKDKRESIYITLPLSGEKFTLPNNLYIIGTMNTSDRSIAMVDAALRRRFAFYRMWPNYEVIKSHIEGLPLHKWLEHINKKLVEVLGQEAYDLLIGHSYLMEGNEPIKDIIQLRRRLVSEIIPLLEEYFRGDFQSVKQVLGTNILSEDGKLLPKTDEELISALIENLPENYKEDIIEQENNEDFDTD